MLVKVDDKNWIAVQQSMNIRRLEHKHDYILMTISTSEVLSIEIPKKQNGKEFMDELAKQINHAANFGYVYSPKSQVPFGGVYDGQN